MRLNVGPPWTIPLLAVLVLRVSAALGAEGDTPPLEVVGEETYGAMSRFYDYDRGIPLETHVLEKEETPTTVRYKIVFRGVRGFLVPSYLELPVDRDGPFPCVLLMHGWSGSKQSWWEDDGYISGGNARKALLSSGYAVMALDAQMHGDRIAENGYAPVNMYSGPGASVRRGFFTLSEICMQTTIDHRRALDYLATRADIDADKIGVLGYSMGGLEAFLLTAVDERVDVTVACVTPFYGDEEFAILPRHYARGIRERPFLMLMGRTDSMCPSTRAQQIKALMSPATSELIFYESGHQLPAGYVVDALAWFERHL